MLRRAIASFVLCVLAILQAPAHAQLIPDRLYFGINRRMPMTVQVPQGVVGEVEIRLYRPTGELHASAHAAPGRVDLASLFPVLWTTDRPGLLYAQLTVATEEIGPPVVLQPMLTPNTAHLVNPATLQPTFDPAIGRPMFDDFRRRLLIEQRTLTSPPEPVTYTGIRAYQDAHVLLDTTLGNIELRLRPDVAPNTAFNFRHLAENGFYTDTIFHRVVERLRSGDRFVIQSGDPSGTGSGGPGYHIDLEPSTLPHDFGVVSMARSPDPNSAGSQFFIGLSRAGTQHLDQNYAAFAQAVSGADVIAAIASAPTGPGDRPIDPPIIRAARLVPAPPFSDRPDPLPAPAEGSGER